MKKILFSAVTLDVGGIETALVTLLNYLAEEKDNNDFKYEITLALEKKQGLFLDFINSRIKIIEYTPCSFKFVPIRKAINFIKQRSFIKKYKNKFDFAASYATYSLPCSFIARTASENSALWCHMDYLEQYRGDESKVKDFFVEKHFEQFKHIIFVSERGRDNFINIYPNDKDRVLWINNLIDYKKIIEKSCEETEEKVDSYTFINIGRHDEDQKKLSRIINAAELLQKDGFYFNIVLIGDGQDTENYKKQIKEKDLDDVIIPLGRKKNPYPYLKKSKCLLLTSDYEGSPVVFTEAMVLNKPIITTDVSGSEQVDNKFGIVTQKNEESIYEAMKYFIQNGYEIQDKFDPEDYNNKIIKEIEKIM